MLSNAYFLAKFRFDTAENEPAKICKILNFRRMHFRKMHFRKRGHLAVDLFASHRIPDEDGALLVDRDEGLVEWAPSTLGRFHRQGLARQLSLKKNDPVEVEVMNDSLLMCFSK